jgi:hypothetical protein
LLWRLDRARRRILREASMRPYVDQAIGPLSQDVESAGYASAPASTSRAAPAPVRLARETR